MIYEIKKQIEDAEKKLEKSSIPVSLIVNDGILINYAEQAALVTNHLQLFNKHTNVNHSFFNKAEDVLTVWSLCLNKNKEVLRKELLNDLNSKPFKPSKNPKFSFIDLFAGIGGFRLAFQDLGGICVFSSEWDQNAQQTYYNNYGDIPFGDITKINEKDIPDFDILCAGFPCQPFSICGRMKGFEDTRGTLFFDVCRIIKEKQPKIVLLENVKHLINHDHKRTFNVIINTLEQLGYNVSHRVLNSSNFGVAQARERIIIVGFRNGCFDFDKIKKSRPIYIKDMLDKEGDFEYLKPEEYTLLDPSLIRKQDSGLIFCGYRNKGQWKIGVRPHTEHLSRVHRQPNRIYHIDGIHPTIPSQEESRRFWIYLPIEKAVRKLTLAECYRLMGFPDNFRINTNSGYAVRQCGNSVVVPMIYELGKAILNQNLNINSYGKLRTNNLQLTLDF